MNFSPWIIWRATRADKTVSMGLFHAARVSLEKMSLVKRILVSSCLVLIVFLSGAALIINSLLAISLDNVVQEKLKLHTYQLITIGNRDNGSMQLPKRMAEPRFNRSGGSLIGFVTELSPDNQQQEVWRSLSAEDVQFTLSVPESGQWFFSRAQSGNGLQYYVSSYNTTWPDDKGGKTKYIFSVMEDFSDYQKKLANYRTAIVIALLVFGLTFLLLQMMILRLGLSPLKKIAADVEAMNNGEVNSLNRQYPEDLKPLITNLNLLIDNERCLRERYRNRMADLSHSLKTPLSVLRGIESDIDSLGHPVPRDEVIDTLNKHVKRMTEIVDYQLQRSIPNAAPTLFSAIDINDTANDIVLALNKVYADKKVECDLNIESGLSFHGDKNDFIEIIGNLLDNAYKHSESLVRLSAIRLASTTAHPKLALTFEDDGAGIPATKRSRILERGVRLDSSSEGQGFGLSIVADIVNSYRGDISIESSNLGGAMFNITIPTR